MPGSNGLRRDVPGALSVFRQALADEHLTQVEAVVVLGLAHIACQRKIIEALRNGRYDTSAAEQLLDKMLKSQALNEGRRDRLRQELRSEMR